VVGQRREARAASDHALEVLEAAPPGRELAMAYSNRAQLAITAHLVDEAAEWSARARELADRVGDPETRLHARVSAGISALYQDSDARSASWSCCTRRQRPGATSSTRAARSRTWPW
jgi:hypothetical protein